MCRRALQRRGAALSYLFGEASSMPSLKRPPASRPGASGRRSIPRLKRPRRRRLNRRASPSLKRPRRRRGGRRRVPSAKPCSVWSGVAGSSFDAVIGLVLSSCRSLTALRLRSASDVPPTRLPCDVTLRPVATPVRRRFLVRAMANVALHLRWAGRGLTAFVVYDANDLAHAAAGARAHGGAPVSDDRFGLCIAALAEDFSDGRHEHPASDSHLPPSAARSRRTPSSLETCGCPT
jgi:hypothetical protein